MDVAFYSCSCDNRYVNKLPYMNYYTDITNVVLYENSSLVTPEIRVTWAGGVPTVNYCYIPLFGRYYYIVNSVALSGNSIKYYLRCDVLMTYKAPILNNAQTVIRSESIGKPTLIPDRDLPISPYKDVKVIPFEGGELGLSDATENTLCYILNVAGGAGS